MPLQPLLQKRFTDDELNLHVTPADQKQYLESHLSFESLFDTILEGNPKKLSDLLKNFDTTSLLNKQLLFLMLQNVYHFAYGEGSHIEWKFETVGLNLIAALIKKLPQLILEMNYLYLTELAQLESLGVDIHWQYQGCDLLYISMTNPNVDKFQLFCWLVDVKGFNLNSDNKLTGTGTPLHAYLASEDFENSKKIIKRYGQNLDLTVKDREGKTLLIIAAKTRAIKSLELLCSLPQLTPDIINRQDEKGRSALHYACILGMKNCVKLLIEKGADINLADNKGNTPLHAAVFPKLKIGSVLRSIEIHPDRAENAPKNALSGVDDKGKEVLATKANAIKYGVQNSNLVPMSLVDAIEASQLNVVTLLVDKKANFIPNNKGELPTDLTNNTVIKEKLQPLIKPDNFVEYYLTLSNR